MRHPLGLPPSLEEIVQLFLFIVQWHLVFFLGVTVYTRNDELGRTGSGVFV